jgi:CheY-like chemotaxis protein/anti-sigma regulatory factor (Ser/Thr protein kinase)
MKRILIVEDEYHIRQNLQQILEFSNYDVLLAENGQEALKIAVTAKPDLIVSDVRMPHMDGYQLLEALRAHTVTQLIPVIFLTARADRLDHRQAMDMGADDYITKPFTPEELLSAVESRLKKSDISVQQHQEELNQFCAQLSRTLPHELNTPLNGIISSIDFLLARYSYFKEEEVLELLKVVQASSQRLHRLIENFLLYAELELRVNRSDPSASLVFSRTNIQTIEVPCLQVAKQYHRSQDLMIECPPLFVKVPESQLCKIFLELVDNAFKFSKAGTPVKITATETGNRITLCIEDQGRGMTREQVSQVRAYVQFERRIYEQQGCGLGLVIAQYMVRLYNGTIDIRSEPHLGTIVTIQFETFTPN